MRIVPLFITMISACLLFTDCHSMDAIKEDLHKMREDIGTIIGFLSPEIGQLIRGEELAAIKNNPYKNEVAYVRQGADISEGEKKYLEMRLPIAKAALEKLLVREISNQSMPTIAIACSGGGYRSLLYTLGFLRGAKKIGLLDTVTYVTSLSGSTGAVAPWISAQYPLKHFKEYILDCVSKCFTQTTDEEELLIFETATVKKMFDQPKTPVDLYGDLLGNRFLAIFGKQRHITYLSDQASIIQNGKYPYPIYTAVDGDENIVENPTWYEITPHEIGNPIDETYIPTWSYGRTFKNGESKKGKCDQFPPEKNLSYHLGTFWSAFGANILTIEKEVVKRIGHAELLDKLIEPIAGQRPLEFYAEIPNYMYKMNTLKNSDSAKAKMSKRVDAGTDCNLPVSPINRPGRQADVIIICDVSAGAIGNELAKTVAYMKRNNLPFPKINLENIHTKTISIFEDKQNPNVPIVMYMPRISDHQLWEDNKSNPNYTRHNLSGFDIDYETNNGFAQTIHFQYERKNAQKVIDQAEFNMRVNQTAIVKAINWVVDKKTQS